MLCGLTIGTRMRAIPFTHGETEKCKLLVPRVQGAMYWAIYAVLAQVQLDEEGNAQVAAVKKYWRWRPMRRCSDPLRQWGSQRCCSCTLRYGATLGWCLKVSA